MRNLINFPVRLDAIARAKIEVRFQDETLIGQKNKITRRIAEIVAPDAHAVRLVDRAGWGGRNRTSEWRNQNPLPYRLATPQ